MTRPKPLASLFLAAACVIGIAPTVTADPFEPAATSQDEGGGVEDKREKVSELCDQFKELIGKRGEEDTAAVAVMDTLLQEFPVSGPKDRELIAETIGKSFDEKRKDLEGGGG